MVQEPTARGPGPLGSLANHWRNRLAGRVHYPGELIGSTVRTKWGKPQVLKQIVVDRPGFGEPEAVFLVRFRLKSMPPALNRIFLNLPVPFFAGLPGFRQKCWLYDRATDTFQGRYEWQTVEDARSYARSFAARFMKKRSVSGSAEYAIFSKETGAEVESGQL